MDRNGEKKERNREDKYRSSHKRKRKKIFYGKRKQELEELNKEPETQEEQLLDDAVSTSKIQHDDEEMEIVPNKTVSKILDIDDGDSVSKDDKLSVITGYKMIHSSILKEMFSYFIKMQKVSTCENCIELLQDNNKRRGLCERLSLKCKHCSTVLGYFDSSPSTECENKLVDVKFKVSYGSHICRWWPNITNKYLYKPGLASSCNRETI